MSPYLVLNTRAEIGYGDNYGSDIVRTICTVNPTPPLIPNAPATTPNAGAANANSPCAGGGGFVTDTLVATGLPFFENFYGGGVRSVRGFRDNTLGPRSEAIGGYRGQPLGGALTTTGSLEMYFPKLFDSKAARISAFVDFGNVFSGTSDFDAGELRGSTGVALLWRAPVGPISISYAFPLRKQDGDEIERLQFTFGGAF